MPSLIKKLLICFLFLIIICTIYFLLSIKYIKTYNNWYYQKYDNISDYQFAKKQINCQKCIKHFPKKIPKDAKNIDFFQYQSYWWGSENIFLKFKANKEYIEKEVEKYSNNKASKNIPQQIFPFDISDFEFYVIFYKTKRFLKEGGIGVNKKNNTILYYYNNPDD